MIRTQQITLDVYEAPYFVYVNAKQNDNDSRVLVITLTDQGKEIKPDHTVDTAVFRARKPDGTCVLAPAAIGEDGKITVALSDQALAVPGDVEADIAVVNGDDILSTASFYIQVARAPVGQEIASENDFLLLLEARDRAEAAAKAAAGSAETAGEHETAAGESADAAAKDRAAAEAAAQLAGEHEQGAENQKNAAEQAKDDAEKAAGEAKQSADTAAEHEQGAETQRKAAEEAAKLAQQIAQGALGYYETPEILRAQHPTAEAGNWCIVGSTDTIWVWDTDRPGWTDSGNKTDLSQYYTKRETDELLRNLTVELPSHLVVGEDSDLPAVLPINADTLEGNGADYFVSKEAATAAKETTEAALQRKTGENILHNARWNKPEYIVNQRNVSGSIDTAGYFIDRWILESGTVELTDNGLVLNGTIIQRLENNPGDGVIASVLTSSGLGDAVYTAENKTFRITASGETLFAAKLEVGDEQTLARLEEDTWVLNDPAPDYGAELAKCQRYQFFKTIYGGHLVTTGNTKRCIIPMPVTMRAVPTIVGEPKIRAVAGNAVQTHGALSCTLLNNGICVTVANVPNVDSCIIVFDQNGGDGFDANL